MIHHLHRRSCLKSLAATALLSLAGGLGTVGSSAARASSSAGAAKNPRVLIAYFTWAGSTEVVAREIKRLIGGDLVRITALSPIRPNTTISPKRQKRKQKKANCPPLFPQRLT